MRDGKSQFYRTLNLDRPTMKLIREYRGLKYLIDRDKVKDDRKII